MHTLIVCNPGHFHAALALRQPHPLLREEVFVYTEDGPDLQRFLALVATFNSRDKQPTGWRLRTYRGSDYLDRLIADKPGDVVLLAGKNNTKLHDIARLQAAGLAVLGDKTWLIDEHELPIVDLVANRSPLAMDMMTERHDDGHRILQALVCDADVFGDFVREGDTPAIQLTSVHHLYKKVNGAPLRRPPWYFDTEVQGEGIMDVTTHLADLALWMTDRGQACDPVRDLRILSARQWPTAVPREVYSLVTGLDAFAAEIASQVREDTLHYLCNAQVRFSIRGVIADMEALWGLTEPEGGGDEFSTQLKGTRATLALRHNRDTAFESKVSVEPRRDDSTIEKAVARAVTRLATQFPGLVCRRDSTRFEITIPEQIRTTHEQHFAKVLDDFLHLVDSGQRPITVLSDLLTKYQLLAHAKARAARG